MGFCLCSLLSIALSLQLCPSSAAETPVSEVHKVNILLGEGVEAYSPTDDPIIAQTPCAHLHAVLGIHGGDGHSERERQSESM